VLTFQSLATLENLFVIKGESDEEVRNVIQRSVHQAKQLAAKGEEIFVIIQGRHLLPALQSAGDHFATLGLLAHSVICCGVTPSQKAQVSHCIHCVVI
jgi:magnesium-transporting ATPase (P-type)